MHRLFYQRLWPDKVKPPAQLKQGFMTSFELRQRFKGKATFLNMRKPQITGCLKSCSLSKADTPILRFAACSFRLAS